jgi:recombination protein RecT
MEMNKMAQTNEKLLAKIDQKQGKPASVSDQIGAYLNNEKVRKELLSALPKHIDVDRLARVALSTIRTNPKLLECSVPSLMAAVMYSAQLGLEPGVLDHIYFIPYGTECKPIIGYKGLMKLARNSGEVLTIGASEIYSNDKFEYKKGFEEVLNHEPCFQDRGQLIGFYAYCLTKDGGRYAEVMTKADVDKIMARAKSKNVWQTDYNMMGRKTVIKRLSKYLPLSIEVAEQFARDDKQEFDLDNATSVELNLGDNIDFSGAKEVAQATIESQVDKDTLDENREIEA